MFLTADAALGLEECFLAHRAQLTRKLFAIVGNREDAEDLAEQVYLRAARARAGVRCREALYGWLCRIALNVARDHLRQRDRRRTESLSYVESEESDGEGERTLADCRPSGLDRILKGEAAAAVRVAVEGLIPLQREAVRLFYWEAHSVAEIAAQSGVAAGTVKSRLGRARDQLRESLGHFEHDREGLGGEF